MNKKFFILGLIFLFFSSVHAGLYGEDIIHIIEKGDTLYAISKKYNVPVNSILKKNSISETSKIKIGQKIIIPIEDTSSKNSSGYISYIIQKGDTLFALAKKFGINFSTILKLNNLTEKSPLKIGQTLKIPKNITKNNKPKTANKKTSSTALSEKTPSAVKPGTSTKKADAKLLWPVPAKTVAYLSGKITGVVIDSVKGQPVKAISSGKVVSTGPHRGFGQVVFVQSKTKHIYVYGGMEKLNVKKGDTIRVGQKLGELGIELFSGKAKLYFMVYDKNTPIDPAKAPRGL